MMHRAIAHHPLINAQLLPKWGIPLPPFPASFYTRCDVPWYGIPCWPVWVRCPGCVLCHLLVPLQLSHWLGMRS